MRRLLEQAYQLAQDQSVARSLRQTWRMSRSNETSEQEQDRDVNFRNTPFLFREFYGSCNPTQTTQSQLSTRPQPSIILASERPDQLQQLEVDLVRVRLADRRRLVVRTSQDQGEDQPDGHAAELNQDRQ